MDENEIELSDDVIAGLKTLRSFALDKGAALEIPESELDNFDEALEWIEQFENED